MPNSAVLVIDYVNDYVHSNGKVTVSKAEDIHNDLMKFIHDCYEHEQEDLIVFCSDIRIKNDVYHPESKKFIDRCLTDSWGRMIYKDMDKECEADRVKFISVDKTRYSAFAGTTLDQKLRERDIKEIAVTGLALDDSILHTCIDAYNLGYKITLISDLVKWYDDDNMAFLILCHLEKFLNVKILTAKQYLTGELTTEEDQ